MCDGTTTTTTGGYGSTSNGGSSNSNGKTTNGVADIEKAPLLISRENTPDSTDGDGNNKGNLTTKRILIGVAIIAVALIGNSILHSRDDNNDSSPNGISWDNDVFNDDDRDEHSDNTDPDTTSSSSNSNSNPFLLDPINDMGMLSIKRNMDASPSIVWGKHLSKKNHPLPTNSWYLVSCIRAVSVRVCVCVCVCMYVYELRGKYCIINTIE
jgi:hypothetical protein